LVHSSDNAEWYNTNDPQQIRWILPDNLQDPRMAHYAVCRDDQIVVRGRNFWIDDQHSYVSRIYTAEAYRGQGLARMLMGRLLADDLMRGARWSVLTASAQGALLYQRLGYRALGTIMIFERPGQ
jgi:predicted GNAT family acetyltransferase